MDFDRAPHKKKLVAQMSIFKTLLDLSKPSFLAPEEYKRWRAIYFCVENYKFDMVLSFLSSTIFMKPREP
jgi:hypothetical protein